MRITKENWHQEWCDEQCEICYCKHHRLIYFYCQSASIYWEERGLIELQNGGRCTTCISDRAKERLADMDREYHRLKASGAM